jgi:hypothetical protein
MIMKKLFLFTLILVFFGSMQAQNNYALQFDGVDDYVDLGGTAAHGLRSIDFWFKSDVAINDTLPETIALVVRNDGTQSHEFGLYIGSKNFAGEQGRITFMRRLNGVKHEVVSDTNSWGSGEWHHVAGVLDETAGMQLYIDGLLQADMDSTVAPMDTAYEITGIGRWGNLAIRHFEGSIDEVHFWTSSLSASEISDLMTNCPAESAAGLSASWRFEEGADTVASDLSMNGNDATVRNGANWSEDAPSIACSTTGIFEDRIVKGIRVYPNPAKNDIFVEIDPANEVQITQVRISDLLGRELISAPLTGDHMQIRLGSRISGGLHLVNFYDAQGQLLGTKKIVVE